LGEFRGGGGGCGAHGRDISGFAAGVESETLERGAVPAAICCKLAAISAMLNEVDPC
jgi:hypothetical protein